MKSLSPHPSIAFKKEPSQDMWDHSVFFKHKRKTQKEKYLRNWIYKSEDTFK